MPAPVKQAFGWLRAQRAQGHEGHPQQCAPVASVPELSMCSNIEANYGGIIYVIK